MFWLDETRAHDAQVLRKVRPALEQLDTDGVQIEILDVAAGDEVHARARPRRQGHDLGHRQRAPRLSHGPVPDPRARYERQDAVGGAADEGWRPVRDGRRRIGAQARPAVPRGEPSALGLARRVPRARPRRSSCSPSTTTTGARSCWPTRSIGRSAACSRRIGRRRARSASSTTAAPTSTWPCIGRPSWRSRASDSDLAARFRPLADQLAANENRIVEELDAVQGSPVDIDGYYRPDVQKVAAAMRPSATMNNALGEL